MKYVLGFPPGFHVKDRSVCTSLNGGACPEPNIIYLYGYGTGTEGLEHRIWSGIIRHEHLHDLLHKNNVPVKFHHNIINFMEPYLHIIDQRESLNPCLTL